MEFTLGDLVQYKNDPGRLGIILEINETSRKAQVCEVVIVYDKTYPQTVGEKRYTHIDYWKKIV
jgi:hypothetical protein|tara:strand:- start:384 stop:575 length:192 start_codon:yes stop_codon:yes gene_type:complete